MRRLAVLLAALLLWAGAACAQQADGTPPKPREGSATPRARVLPGISITISPAAILSWLNRPAPQRGDEAVEPGQLLIWWADDEAAREGLDTLAQRGLQPLQSSTLAELGGTLALIQLADEPTAAQLRDELRAQRPEWIVDLNARAWPMQREAPAPVPGPRLYALQMLGIDGAATSAGALRLGVIDSPIDPALLQPDAARLWNGSSVLTRNLLAAGDTPAGTAHGTAVALLIAAAPLPNGFAGAAPPLQMSWAVAMRQVGEHASSNSWLLAQAFDWLLSRQVQAINLSLGGAGDQILRSVVERVLARRVALLAAAGNRPDSAPVFPAAYPGVWAVTAVDAQGLLYARASRGSHVAFAAPGVDVWVPELASGSTPHGRYVSGTSYATALASAALARWPGDFWQLATEQRKSRLCAAARPAAPVQGALGCGILHLEAASPSAAAGAPRP